jgi:glutathione synthase/RimK-type ligase-like ATP-grasp enzyme
MNVLILTTRNGRKYAQKIGREIKNLGHTYYRYHAWSINLALENHPELNNSNTVIHSRAANPNTSWMDRFFELESQGFKFINKPSVLKLTSDKWECLNFLQLRYVGNCPLTFSIPRYTPEDGLRNIIDHEFRNQDFIIKPRYSQGGGQFVFKETRGLATENLRRDMEMIPLGNILFQEVVSYTIIYRVFVINNHALPFVTYDTPEIENNWKVSVCLNRNQRVNVNPPRDLLNFAENIQLVIGGKVNFIDIFGTTGGYVLSEVNTACNLTIHEQLSGYNIARKIAEYLTEGSND